MLSLRGLFNRLREAMRPIRDTEEDRILTEVLDRNVKAAQRGARAAKALEDLATLVRNSPDAGHR